MDAKELFYFKRTAELEHMTKAAQSLYVSQAYLSRVIANIEKELGVPVFDRKGRGIKLNESGKAFYDYVNRILDYSSRGVRAAREAYAKKNFQLSMATNAGAYMPDLLTKVARLDDSLRIRQYSAPRRSLISMLNLGTVNFVITSPPINEMGITSIAIRKETPVAIVPPGHRLEGRESIRIDDLRDELFVGVPEGYAALDSVMPFYRERDMRPTFSIETGDTSSVTELVKRGFGVAVVPESLISMDESFKDTYLPFSDCPNTYIGLSWRSDHEFSEFDTAFVDVVKEHFATLYGPKQDLSNASIEGAPEQTLPPFLAYGPS